MDQAALPRISLTSDGFSEGGTIPARYTCDGANLKPVLHWGDPPAGTRSFALVIDDPDAPRGTFRHWGVYDIPATVRAVGSDQVGREVVNDFGNRGYGGPCPPKGHGPHHYHFRLFALSVGQLDLQAAATVADLEQAATRHAVGTGELVGVYERR